MRTGVKLAEADLATQARLTALNLGQTIQTSTKSTAETFNRFVENQGANETRSPPLGYLESVDDDKRDFWENFGGAAGTTSRPSGTAFGMGAGVGGSKPSAIGTAAMRKGGAGVVGGKGKKEEGWDDDKWENF